MHPFVTQMTDLRGFKQILYFPLYKRKMAQKSYKCCDRFPSILSKLQDFGFCGPMHTY
jgi:hypothetical protein